MWAFDKCRNLQNINSENIIGISASSFRDCKSLTSFTFNENLEYLENYAFEGCYKLDTIYANMKYLTPFTNEQIFLSYNYGALLYVQPGMKNKYMNTKPWSNFKNIVELAKVEWNTPANGTMTIHSNGKKLESGIRLTTGTEINVNAIPDEGYLLDSLYCKVDGRKIIDIKESQLFELNENTVINAKFVKKQYSVSFNSTNEGGKCCVMNLNEEIESGSLFDFGTMLIVVPYANEGYVLENVYVNEETVDPVNGIYFVKVNENLNIDVRFKKTDSSSVSYDNNPAGGSFRVMKEIETDESVANGTVLYVNAVPEEGYEVKSVSAGDAEVEFADGLYMFPVTDDTVIEVIFKAVEQSAVNSVKENKVYYDSWSKMLHVNGANLVKVYNVDGIEILNSRNGQDINVSGFAKGLYVADVDGVMVKFRV